MPLTLLTIEDDTAVRQSIAAYFQDSGFVVSEAADGLEGLELFRRERPDIILTDLRLPGKDGLEIIATVRTESPETPIIIVSGMGKIDDAIEAIHLGAWDYVTKPVINMADLQFTVNQALERARLIRENHMYQEHLEELVRERTTELRKANDQLTALFQTVEQAKEEWQRTVDTIDEGILLVDADDIILRANQMMAQWLRTTPQALDGQSSYRVIYNSDPPSFPSWQSPQAVKREMELPHLGGTFRLSSFPIFDSRGQKQGAVNVLKDVTEEKRLQAKMIQSEKLAAMGQMAASLAHEIKNPLQVLEGCLAMTQSTIGDVERQQQYLQMAQEEFERLTKIVQQILDYFRPSKGIRSPTDVHAVLCDVLALSHKRMQQANVQVKFEWDANIPTIKAVNSQLKQVFLNLIINAIEAMPQGGEIFVHGGLVRDERDWIIIAVRDSGAGIPSEQLEKTFEPFYTTKTTGTGLGLPVCRNIIDNHGGRITVESIVGQGSTFTVWLPCDEVRS